MTHDENTLAPIDHSDLGSAWGGAGKLTDLWRGSNRHRTTGSYPSTPMEILDNPPRALNVLRQTLGIKPSGRPGDTYTPPSANPDGSINEGRFDPPPSAVKVPFSE